MPTWFEGGRIFGYRHRLIEYSYELIGLVLGAAGTFVGTKLLKRISDNRFRMLLNIV